MDLDELAALAATFDDAVKPDDAAPGDPTASTSAAASSGWAPSQAVALPPEMVTPRPKRRKVASGATASRSLGAAAAARVKEEEPAAADDDGGGALVEIASPGTPAPGRSVKSEKKEDDEPVDKECLGCGRGTITGRCWLNPEATLTWALPKKRGQWCRDCYNCWRLCFQEEHSLHLFFG